MGFKKVEDVVGPAVYDSDADVIISVVGVRGLVDFRGARGNDVRGVEVFVKCIRLAGVNHEEHLVIPAPFPTVSPLELVVKA